MWEETVEKVSVTKKDVNIQLQSIQEVAGAYCLLAGCGCIKLVGFSFSCYGSSYSLMVLLLKFLHVVQ
jgi:hypothetical protein